MHTHAQAHAHSHSNTPKIHQRVSFRSGLRVNQNKSRISFLLLLFALKSAFSPQFSTPWLNTQVPSKTQRPFPGRRSSRSRGPAAFAAPRPRKSQRRWRPLRAPRRDGPRRRWTSGSLTLDQGWTPEMDFGFLRFFLAKAKGALSKEGRSPCYGSESALKRFKRASHPSGLARKNIHLLAKMIVLGYAFSRACNLLGPCSDIMVKFVQMGGLCNLFLRHWFQGAHRFAHVLCGSLPRVHFKCVSRPLWCKLVALICLKCYKYVDIYIYIF